MSNVPKNLRYTEEHEWADLQAGDGVVVIGITDHAQAALGDVVFLELPDAGKTIAKGKAFGVVESVKAVSDLYAPIDGTVVAVNSELVNSPERVNQDAYGSWLIKVQPADKAAFGQLMDSAGYEAMLAKIAK